jgi:hypothetical protein
VGAVSGPPPGTITVTLANSRKVGARSCAPGDVVTLPAEAARDLIREGLAVQA